jgi:hypothetical protein
MFCWMVRGGTIGLSGTPCLCIFCSPHNLGVLESVGHRRVHTSSGSDDFFRSNLVFRSTDSVGSLLNLW